MVRRFNRRFLVIPDENITPDKVTRVGMNQGDNHFRNFERGRSVRQPEPVASPQAGGDIKPLLEGVPEFDTGGTIGITKTGVVDRARYTWQRYKDLGDDAQLRQSPIVMGRRIDLLRRSVVGEPNGVRYLNRPKALSLLSGDLLVCWTEATNNPLFFTSGVGAGGSPAVNRVMVARRHEHTKNWEEFAVPALDTNEVGSGINQSFGIFAADVVQYPDTGMILLVAVSNSPYTFGFGSSRRLTILVSEDEGTTWTLRSEQVLAGSDPDILLVNGNEPPPRTQDITALFSVSCELTENGRLVCVVATGEAAYSLISTDRGMSFTPYLIGTDYRDQEVAGFASVRTASTSITRLRNGLLFMTICVPDHEVAAPQAKTLALGYFSADGVDWGPSGGVDLWQVGSGGEDIVSGLELAVVMRPDGWPMVYMQAHQMQPFGNPTDFMDWLSARTMSKRDPTLADDQSTLFPYLPVGQDIPRPFHIFHGIESSPSGDLKTEPQSAVFQGFAGGLDAILHRGEVLIVTQVIRELSASSLEESALVVYNTAFTQPCEENLGYVQGNPATANAGSPYPNGQQLGRIYNRTWDCYGLPSNWGFAPIVAAIASSAIFDASAIGEGTLHGGFLKLDTTAAAPAGTVAYWEDLGLPNVKGADKPSDPALDPTAMYATLRIVNACVSGGSLTLDDVAVHLFLEDFGPGLSTGIIVRYYYDGTGTWIEAFDAAGTSLGGGAVFHTHSLVMFFETLVGIWPDPGGSGDVLVSVLIRPYKSNPAAQGPDAFSTGLEFDPDWDRGYVKLVDKEQVSTSLVLPAAPGGSPGAEVLRWGDLAGLKPSVSYWKSVHLHRPDTFATDATGAQVPALAQQLVTYKDTDHRFLTRAFSAAGGEGYTYRDFGQNDTGMQNLMRSTQMTASPAQWIERGVSVSWRGEAITTGQFTHRAGYDYAGKRLFGGPVVEEWKSLNGFDFYTNAVVPTIVPDVEIVLDSGALFTRPFRPESIAVFGRNFPNMQVQFNTVDTEAQWLFPIVSYTLGIPGDGTTPDRYTHLWAADGTVGMLLEAFRIIHPTATPWRPHQFKTQETGPRFYVLLEKSSAETPAFPGVLPRNIYRIIDNTDNTLFLATDPLAGGFSGVRNEYTTIYSDRFAVQMDHKYPDNVGYRYMRLLIPGCARRDSDEWFHRAGRVFMGQLADLSDPDFLWGWGRSEASGQKIISTTSGVRYSKRLSSPRRNFSVGHMPLRAPREANAVTNSPPDKGLKSWAEVIELIRGIEIDGERVALIWEGERAVGLAGEAVVQVTADPIELLAVRAQIGSIQHQAYNGQTMNLPGGNECVPRPIMSVDGIVFDEEF